MKSREEILTYLFGLHRDGAIKYDLARMHEACGRIGNPQLSSPCIHVAGTNGKGSVCSMIESILRASGRRTGLFIKPHLVDFEERYLVDGRRTHDGLWVDVYREIEPAIADLGLSFFELSTLVAFEVFRRERVEWAVYETGLGGRLDATNVVSPAVSVIASVDMDHTDWLGDTIEKIAAEKLGIVKPGVPVVMLEPPQQSVRALARETCARLGAPLTFVSAEQTVNVTGDVAGSVFEWRGAPIRVPLAGAHQVVNALAAIEASRLAGVTDDSAIARGLAGTFVPARFQCMDMRGKTVVFDIAHNPQAGEALARSIRSTYGSARVCVVTGLMKDKDVGSFLAHLAGVAGEFVFTQPAIPRALEAHALASLLRAPVPSRVVAPVSAAIDQALASTFDVVVVTGSFYTVGEAMAHLGIEAYPRAVAP